MLTETDAIILHTIKYSETSVIAHIYTEQFGNGTYIMNNVRTNRSKMALFQPLSYVHLSVIRKKDPKQIHRITSISFAMVPANTTTNVYKSTIALFVGEITDRIFKEEEQQFSFFQFLKSFVLLLEESEQYFANLHILYLLHVCRFIGVTPKNNYSRQAPYFSLRQAQFVETNEEYETLTIDDSRLFGKILCTQEITDVVTLNRLERQHLLHIMMQYYDIHICKTENIKSLTVLQMVFE